MLSTSVTKEFKDRCTVNNEYGRGVRKDPPPFMWAKLTQHPQTTEPGKARRPQHDSTALYASSRSGDRRGRARWAGRRAGQPRSASSAR